MPVSVSSFLLPRNNASWYVLEDTYLRGGFRIVANLDARDKIHVSSKKARMVVITADDGKIWQLQPDGQTWVEFRPKTSYFPFHTHDQPTPQQEWLVEHGRATKYFTYTLFTSEGEQVIPDGVTLLDENKVVFKFNVPISGHVTLSFAEMS